MNVAKFSTEQAAAVAAIQQVINEWGDELDQNSGLKMTEADVLTKDCRYFVGGEWREGIARLASVPTVQSADLLRYLQATHATGTTPAHYPGSPILALDALRPGDRAVRGGQ